MARSPLYTRRGLLKSAAGAGLAGAALGVPRAARASVSPADRKFVFVFACGGWDPTRVFADGFDNPLVDMEGNAERAWGGDLPYIACPSRPSVTTFFDRYAGQTALIQGMLVPSIAHEACFILAMTGGFSDAGSDWAAILGAAARGRYAAPTLVLGGPSFPGVNLPSVVICGANGQLSALVGGEATTWSAENNLSMGVPTRSTIDDFVRRRAAAVVAGASSRTRAQAAAFASAHEQAMDIKGYRHQISFADILDLSDAFTITAEALSIGLSRSVMVCSPVSGLRDWDSHTSNQDLQNVMFEDLFENLLTLMFLLEASPGTVAPTLLEETTVVVFSEMGRTPWNNSAGGKDHWPYTSAMLVGSGIRGGVNVGQWTDDWHGEPIDLGTGEARSSGASLGTATFGATLLTLGDVDPAEWCGDVQPITAVIA